MADLRRSEFDFLDSEKDRVLAEKRAVREDTYLEPEMTSIQYSRHQPGAFVILQQTGSIDSNPLFQCELWVLMPQADQARRVFEIHAYRSEVNALSITIEKINMHYIEIWTHTGLQKVILTS